mgnify:CR=1 FL=1
MDQSKLLKYLVNTFNLIKIEYFITGSIASIFYGEPRFTNDIDIVAKIEEKHIPELIKRFPDKEFYIDKDSIIEAIKEKSQFNIIHPSSGLKIDVIIYKENDFDFSRFERVKRISPIEGIEANFASPEDVIIMKMKYYKEKKSEKHLRDIYAMLNISSDLIDKEYIKSWAHKLDVLDVWELILQKK